MGVGHVDHEPEFRSWRATKGTLLTVLRWWAWSVALAPIAAGGVVLVIEFSRGAIPPGRAFIAVLLAALIGGILAAALIVVGAVGCLPFFLLIPSVIKRAPWCDRSLLGALLLCLLLAIPAPVALGAVWGFGSAEPGEAVLAYLAAAVSIAIPRFASKRLRVGVLSTRI